MRKSSTPPPQKQEPRRRSWAALVDALGHLRLPRAASRVLAQDGDPFRPRLALHPPGVRPAGGMAMDRAGFDGGALDWAATWPGVGCVAEGFLGYPILAEMAQRPEYRRVVETVASEMTREWIELKSTGDDDKSDKIGQLTDAMQRFRLRDGFRRMAEHDGFFGRGHLYIDTGDTDRPDELLQSIGNGRDEVSKAKIGKGSLKAFRPIEPVWTYPQINNSINPLAAEWYAPATWNVMSTQLHSSRLLTLIAREVPDLLKPAYSFGGLSLTQMVKPYVDKFIKDAMSISDLVAAFSIMVLKTNLAAQLQVGGQEFNKRMELFTRTRNNFGTFVVDSESGEELTNVSAPLGGLEGLQAQSQEHILSAAGMPAIKYTGLTPTGLNTSSEGEIRSWYDGVKASQEYLFREPLTKCLGVMQLSEFGEIDPEITFDFVSLWQLDDERKIAIEKLKADIHDVYMTAGVVSATTVRQSVAADPDSLYHGIDMSQDADLDVPPPEPGEIDDPSDPIASRVEREAETAAA